MIKTEEGPQRHLQGVFDNFVSVLGWLWMTWLAEGMGNKGYFKIYDTSIKSEFAGISRHCKSYRLIATWLARGGLIGWRVFLFRKQFTYRYGRRRHWTASSGGFCWQTSCSVPSRPPTPLAVWRSISRFLPLVQRLLKWLLDTWEWDRNFYEAVPKNDFHEMMGVSGTDWDIHGVALAWWWLSNEWITHRTVRSFGWSGCQRMCT